MCQGEECQVFSVINVVSIFWCRGLRPTVLELYKVTERDDCYFLFFPSAPPATDPLAVALDQRQSSPLSFFGTEQSRTRQWWDADNDRWRFDKLPALAP